MRLLSLIYIFFQANRAKKNKNLRHISLGMHCRAIRCTDEGGFNKSAKHILLRQSLFPSCFFSSFRTLPRILPPYTRLFTQFGWISYYLTDILQLESINRFGFYFSKKFMPAIITYYSCSCVITYPRSEHLI